MKRARSKPVAGHKFGGVSFCFQTSCECGWRSATWIGKGGQASAIAEWHQHLERHKREAERAALHRAAQPAS